MTETTTRTHTFLLDISVHPPTRLPMCLLTTINNTRRREIEPTRTLASVAME